MEKYLSRISELTGIHTRQVASVSKLHGEGSSVPFMARYRKEATGNLDEVQINAVIEQIRYFDELEQRKETVIKTIGQSGKLTPELQQKIDQCLDATVLEDIYLPYKPKRKTRAVAAVEKGLEPLAAFIFEQGPGQPDQQAIAYVNDRVSDVSEALQGARDIIAEWIAENENARAAIRSLFEREAMLYARVVKSKTEDPEAQKYRDYFDFSEPLKRCPSHRLLAIRRGEKDGFLSMDITIDKSVAIAALEKIFIKKGNANSVEVKAAQDDGYDRLLKPSIENEFRLISKNSADEEAIRVFAENLRQLLLASPLGSKKILALDPGFRTGCKLVCLDAQGQLVYHGAVYPHPPQHQAKEAADLIHRLIGEYDIEAIGIGNGTAGRETEQFVRSLGLKPDIGIFQVNESGASIYSASEVAREEFPDHDVTVRGAVSIGRRLLDPLSELVKIDAKSIGVGQYQHDVNQARLKESLDKVVESCVNHVGVDVNTASKHLLMYVSGLSASLARNIVDYRNRHGAFKTREALKDVSMMGPKTFEQCAGFLRIRQAENVLDSTAVHPESYHVVSTMAGDLGCTVAELVQSPELRKKVSRSRYVSESVGTFTIDDIMQELEKPGRDPRARIEAFQFDASVQKMEDLKPGMSLPGIVTNITNFGAFVDIGVKQDGLVHVSQLSSNYVSDPNQVVKLQQRVMVTVTDVDVARKRIALSMKAGSKGMEKQGVPAMKRPRGERPEIGKDAPESFQDKLDALKKRYR